MDQNNTKKDVPAITTRRGWLNISVGLILVLLSLIGATGKTAIGTLLVYCLSYLFGLFYPFVLAFFFIFGLRLIISRHLIPFKGQSILWAGTILLVVSLLAFGSYSVYTSVEGGVKLADFVSVYNNRMLSFASGPWAIDNFETLPSLGGGYLGLFLLSLFGSIWNVVGNIIVFSILLAVSVFFLLFRPVRAIVIILKTKKEKQIDYNSPYRPNKEKTNPHMSRTVDEDQTLALHEETISHNPSDELTAPFSSPWSNSDQGSFTPVDESVYGLDDSETYEDNTSMIDDDFHISATSSDDSFTSYQHDETPASPDLKQAENEISQPRAYQNQPQAPSYQPQAPSYQPQTPSYQPQTPSFASQPTPVYQPEPPRYSSAPVQPPYQPEPETDNFGFSENDVRLEDDEEEQEKYVPPMPQRSVDPYSPRVENPLAHVNRTTPVKDNKPQEFTVLSAREEEEVVQAEPEIIKPVVSELTEEEKEMQREQAFFARKQQEKANAILAKKRQKEEKIASLMKYCSDVPKNYNYQLPSDALLSEIDDSAKVEKNTKSAQEKANIINRVFDEFGVKAKATTFTIGASVTRFNVETQHGEKADKIANLTSEFQRALNGDKSVRVETVVEGRSTSGIEVGNLAPMAVSFKDMFIEIEQDTEQPLLLPIGKDISGNTITFPLNKMPHMLVAGATASGKSVLIHSMIMTIIMRTYPSQAKLMLIDPKQVEFVRYQDEPHLLCPVINKPEPAILALKKLCEEMDRRFSVLSKVRCSNLEDYNEIRRGHEYQYEEMPYIITVIDEFADLMQTGGSEVTQHVTRIAQKARACGIHLIIATQRPSKDTVPMIIKANVPCRIGLSVSSQIDSRVILDENGAETLLGRGDLLFKCPGKKSLIRAQSPFISNKDINTIIEYVREKAGDPVYHPNFLDLEVEKEEEESVNPDGDLYSDIREYVIETGITSKASIMRSFQVSTQKADQFLSRLQAEAVIALGPNGKYILGPAAHLEDYE